MEKSRIAIVAAALLHVSAANAQIEDTPNLSFDGFGTVGVAYSDEDQAEFVAGTLAPDGAGHTRELSPEVDSRLGLQLTANLTPRLTGIVQTIVEQRYDDTYKPTLEWANLKYDITQDLSVRAGRMVLPVFMVSEFRKVGYANPWVRPPQEVYSVIPVSNFDGITASFSSRFDGFTNTLRGLYGRKDVDTSDLGELNARDGVAVNDTLEWGDTVLFAQYTRFRLTIEETNPLFDAFRRFGPEGEAIADRFDVDDKRFEIMSVGARHDPGDWFVMGEWVHMESRTFVADSQGWYVTGGYRYGSLTPYVTLAGIRADSNTSDPGVSPAGLPPPLAARAGGLNATLNQLLGSAAQQKSISLGTRWDFARNVALKVQFDHLDLDDGSQGVLDNTQPGFEPGGSVNLFSVALDFVF